MSGYIGKDGFAWFFGVVEDRNDPKKIGRVKVRIFGYHSPNKKELPKKDLPWAMPIQGITSAGSDGIGASPTGLKEGSWVFGFFADSGSYQVPMILGSLSGLNCKVIKELNEQNGVATSELFSFPKTASSVLNQIKYPSGKNKDGDDHGAQLPDQSKQSPLQRTEYSADSTKSKETPDTNILAINDKERLDKTIVQAKRKPRSEGGAQDDEIPTADIDFPKFKSGVINQSGVNKGTNKSMATGYNGVSSSSEPSKKETAKQVKDRPTNSSGKSIFSNGSSGYSSAFSSFLPGLAYTAGCASEGTGGGTGGTGGSGTGTGGTAITAAIVTGGTGGTGGTGAGGTGAGGTGGGAGGTGAGSTGGTGGGTGAGGTGAGGTGGGAGGTGAGSTGGTGGGTGAGGTGAGGAGGTGGGTGAGGTGGTGDGTGTGDAGGTGTGGTGGTGDGTGGTGDGAGGTGGTGGTGSQNTYKNITQNIKNGLSDIRKNIEDLNIKNYGKPLIGTELLKQLTDANTAANEEKQNNVTTTGISLPRSKDQNKNLSKPEPTDGSSASEHCVDCD